MSVQIDAVISAIEGEVTRTRNEAAFAILAELEGDTPVDTGEARSGWRVAGGEASAIGSGVEVRIDNPVDHIEFLARGSSPQAADGWVERAVERGAAIVEAEVLSREIRL